jgi:D-alanine-D-alanine ligase
MTIEADPDWWKTMFDELYLLTDARSVCDEEITRREVDLICQLLPIRSSHRVLDLCGGHGRHSLELCARGFGRCTLVDYSEFLLKRGRSSARERKHTVDFIQADARNTGLASGSFNHVLILGNSLGYARDAAADREILSEARRVLRPGGWLLLDLADGTAVRDRFNPEAWHEIGREILVCRRRQMRTDTVFVREMVLSKEKGLLRDSTYSIRLYEPARIAALLDQVGFEGIRIITDFSPHRAPGDYGFMNHRMIALGQKA